jgi:hypothetical protein
MPTNIEVKWEYLLASLSNEVIVGSADWVFNDREQLDIDNLRRKNMNKFDFVAAQKSISEAIAEVLGPKASLDGFLFNSSDVIVKVNTYHDPNDPPTGDAFVIPYQFFLVETDSKTLAGMLRQQIADRYNKNKKKEEDTDVSNSFLDKFNKVT